MIASLLLCVGIVGQSADAGSSQPSTPPPNIAAPMPRLLRGTIDDWRATLRGAMRDTTPVTAEISESSVRRLLDMYRELDGSTPFGERERQRWHDMVRSRLARLAEAHSQAPASSKSKAPETDNASTPANPAANLPVGPQPDKVDIAIPVGAAPVGNAPAGGEPVLAQLRQPRAARARQGLGGAMGMQQQGPVRNAQPPDGGDDLVKLIEATIAPSSWDTVGGLGSIRYYRPGQALIVRQSQGVQQQIGPLLGGLRQ